MAVAKRPDLSSRQLHCVVALARYGSFVAAAADLGLSQPALTRAIMRIEHMLGVRLFTRSTRRVALTAAGREFVPVAERLIADLDIGIQNMRTLGAHQRGRLVIASLMSVAYGLLPGIIAAYRARYIGVDLELREGVLSAVTEDVRSGLADFGIGDVTNPSAIPAAVEAELLSESAFRVVLPGGHPLARKRSLRMADLQGESIIAMPFGAGMRRSVDGAAAAAGIAFDRTITVSQFATIFKLVQAGVGLSIVPELALTSATYEGLVSRTLREPSLGLRLGLLRLRDRPVSPAAEGFIELLRTRLGGSGSKPVRRPRSSDV
jgi:DNA-binding transcriptional LysR family regulator